MEKEIKQIFTIELSKPSDAEGIYDVFEKTWISTYPRIADESKYTITKEEIEQKFNDREKGIKNYSDSLIHNQSNNSKSYIVKNDEDKVIGTLYWVKNENENRIKALYVLPEYQGKGVGSILMQKAIDDFGDNSKIILNVASYNENAIKFYEKWGFKKIRDLTEDDRFIKGKVIPEVEMIRNNI